MTITQKLTQKYMVPCYKKLPVSFVSGRGNILVDETGKKYLDLFSGWAVNGLGYSPPHVVKAIRDQASKLIHVPNNFHHPGQALLAQRIIKHSFPGKVFFCNSGAESIEGAIKLARLYGRSTRHEIITMKQSFHGRTMGAMSATGQSKFHSKTKPILAGFRQVDFNDITAVKKAKNSKTVAILIELIQGEGGVNVADAKYIQELRKFATENDILLIVDEVQTGMGRTGKLFCFEHYGFKPDVCLLAKSLGGGFPIGVIIAGEKVKDVLEIGTHASTFGGNPLACAASNAVFDSLLDKGILKKANHNSKIFWKHLRELKKRHTIINDIRGKGFMIGIELKIDASTVVEQVMDEGVLINATQGNVVRLAPALTSSLKDLAKGLKVLDNVLKKCMS